jgi:hypothetical protein
VLGNECYWFRNKEDSKDLFVPFASEQYLSFADQEKRFVSVPDAKEFFEKKRQENEKADARMRYASIVSRHGSAFTVVWGYAMLSLFTSVIGILVGLANLGNRTMDVEPVTVYTTSPDGGVAETHTTYKEQFNLPVKNQNHLNWIYVGKVIELIPIGGNISQICIPYGTNPKGKRCGRADSSLHIKKGDVVYMHPLDLLNWNDGLGDYHGFFEDNIVITKSEAEQLSATGKFTVEK